MYIVSYDFFVTDLCYFVFVFIKFEFKHIYVVSLRIKVNDLAIKLKVKNIIYILSLVFYDILTK